MRLIAALLMIAIHASAGATIIQIDAVGTPQVWTYGGATPSQMSFSVLLDTSAASQNLQPLTGSNGIECLGHFDGQFSGQILDVSANGASLATALSGGVSSGGDHASVSCAADQQSFFAFFSIDAGDFDLGFSYDSRHALSLSEVLGAADPLAALFLSTQFGGGGGSFSFFSPSGMALGDFTASVREVPEPATLGLLMLGLLGLALRRRAAS